MTISISVYRYKIYNSIRKENISRYDASFSRYIEYHNINILERIRNLLYKIKLTIT